MDNWELQSRWPKSISKRLVPGLYQLTPLLLMITRNYFKDLCQVLGRVCLTTTDCAPQLQGWELFEWSKKLFGHKPSPQQPSYDMLSMFCAASMVVFIYSVDQQSLVGLINMTDGAVVSSQAGSYELQEVEREVSHEENYASGSSLSLVTLISASYWCLRICGLIIPTPGLWDSLISGLDSYHLSLRKV